LAARRACPFTLSALRAARGRHLGLPRLAPAQRAGEQDAAESAISSGRGIDRSLASTADVHGTALLSPSLGLMPTAAHAAASTDARAGCAASSIERGKGALGLGMP